jgi:hypothetical protein
MISYKLPVPFAYVPFAYKLPVPFVILCAIGSWTSAQVTSYSAQGDNLIHVATADFDDVGAKEYPVAMTVSGKVIAFDRPAAIVDPSADNRLWEFEPGPSFGIMVETGEADSTSPGEEVLLPGTDGHLRIVSRDGVLLLDKVLETGVFRPGPLYCADTGVNSAGEIRIIAGGVDRHVYILDEAGTVLGKIQPPSAGVIRRVVVGNFDGVGGDEVMAFYNRNSFSGGTWFYPIDLDTLTAPAYWGSSNPMEDDVMTVLGWTDKQLPYAYDMDGDGDEEVVGHWGVLHPELGIGTGVLSTQLTWGERLRLREYTDAYEDTSTGKYLLQQGVPGNFRSGSAYPGPEMLTIYGDDLYFVDYDLGEPDTHRFRVKEYSYAHTLYHFTDIARLEDRVGGLDKAIVTGPVTGDDRFHVIDLSDNQWVSDIKQIDQDGVLVQVRSQLDDFEDGIDGFQGTVATSGEPIWYIDYFASWLGWEMTDANIQTRADGVKAAMDQWSEDLFGPGYTPTRIHWTASLSLKGNGKDADPDITPEGLVAYAEALAQRGVRFCIGIGKGPTPHLTAENFADIFEASIVDGVCHMMARTKELLDTEYLDAYKPHMDAVIARAAQLGVDPPKVMLCGKGPIFSALSPSKASMWFPAYKDVFVPGVENSNVTVVDWSFAERVGLWLNGDVEDWGCNSIGDNIAANRVAEWGGMRNGHIVLRQLLSQYAMGAKFFRITSIQGRANPLYERGDTSDPELRFSSAYRQGIHLFLKLVEKGVFPNNPARDQLKGLSPVAVALNSPNYQRLEDQTHNHDYFRYSPQTKNYVINNLACWYAYTDVPSVDATAIFLNTKRRYENLFPTSPAGFVPMIPYASRTTVEALPWCNRAYQTNGDTWSEFGQLSDARDAIGAELLAQRESLPFYPDGECFWQLTQDKNDPDTLFALLMDSEMLTPTPRTVSLKKGSAMGDWAVYDQLDSTASAIGGLGDSPDGLSIDIPAGGVRLLVIKRAPVAITGTRMSPTRELSLDFRGAPSTAYEVMKSPDLSTFDSFSPPMMETTDPAGKATVVIPSSEIQEDAQFFRIETAQ